MRLSAKGQAPRLDRRELLALGGAAALSFAAPSGIGIAAVAPRRSGAMLAVADPRYDDSRHLPAASPRAAPASFGSRRMLERHGSTPSRHTCEEDGASPV